MATLLKTSRTQVDRLLDAKDDITLSSLQRAAAIVGRRVTIALVQPAGFQFDGCTGRFTTTSTDCETVVRSAPIAVSVYRVVALGAT